MSEENQIQLAIAILELEVDKIKIKRNKSRSQQDYDHYNSKIMGFVESITALRSYINPEIDEN